MGVIGERLKEARENSGLSQVAFAASIGVSVNTISNWERGVAQPPAEKLALIREKYTIDLNWLMTGEEAMMPQGETRAAASSQSVNADMLQQVIEAVEEGLARMGTALDSSKKARLTVLLYKYSTETKKRITAEIADEYLALII